MAGNLNSTLQQPGMVQAVGTVNERSRSAAFLVDYDDRRPQAGE
jgi:hypothetical protein